MEEQKTSKRVRINLTQTAKGLVQIDCTAEHETSAENEAALNEAFAVARRVIAKNGLKEVGSE
jgi:hypothetical protein